MFKPNNATKNIYGQRSRIRGILYIGGWNPIFNFNKSNTFILDGTGKKLQKKLYQRDYKFFDIKRIFKAASWFPSHIFAILQRNKCMVLVLKSIEVFDNFLFLLLHLWNTPLRLNYFIHLHFETWNWTIYFNNLNYLKIEWTIIWQNNRNKAKYIYAKPM